jgi:hypothetical protein
MELRKSRSGQMNLPRFRSCTRFRPDNRQTLLAERECFQRRCEGRQLPLRSRAVAVATVVCSDTTHKHKDVVAWLAKHPRFQLHFTPTSSSWLDLVERWFRELTGKALGRGVFHSLPDLSVVT